jgi:dihydrodipicolinate synthase/N-acetylneuraminate lyase
MPYFVFSVRPFAQIEKLAEFAGFKEASAHAKQLRATNAVVADAKVKVMFADNQLLAEDLLCRVREPGPSGDD